MGTDTISLQLEYYLGRILTVEGFVAAGLFLMLAVILGIVPVSRWVTLAFIIWVASLGFGGQRWFDDTLNFPLQQLRGVSRAVALSLLLLLLIPTLMNPGGWRTRIAFTAVALYVMQVIHGLLNLVSGGSTRAMATVVVSTLMFVVLGLGVSRWLQSGRDVLWLLRTFALAAGVLVVATCYQLVLNRNAIVWNGRLLATTANPQFAAVYLSLTLPAVCLLTIRTGATRSARVLYGGLAGVMGLMLVWTGSRTGFLMSVVGLMLLFRLRFIRLFATVAVAAAAGFGVLWLLGEQVQADRLVSTENTRGWIWGEMIRTFLENPITGSGGVDAGLGESSYLAAASRLGLLGLIPLGVLVIAMLRDCVRLTSARSRLGNDAMLADLVVAGLGAMLVGAMFEAFLLGSLIPAIFFLYANLALARYLLDVAEVRESGFDVPYDAVRLPPDGSDPDDGLFDPYRPDVDDEYDPHDVAPVGPPDLRNRARGGRRPRHLLPT